MLARYQIVRGKRKPSNPLPKGTRLDVRMHRSHVLSPEPAQVKAFLAEPDNAHFKAFARAYRALLAARFARSRAEFDALAHDAMEADVYLGCSCPTRKNPDVAHCHTSLALAFMKRKYPKLEVKLP